MKFRMPDPDNEFQYTCQRCGQTSWYSIRLEPGTTHMLFPKDCGGILKLVSTRPVKKRRKK